MKCPICQQPVAREENRFLPFCSERCKLIDLGKWLGEEYRVPGPPEEQAEDSDEDPTLH